VKPKLPAPLIVAGKTQAVHAGKGPPAQERPMIRIQTDSALVACPLLAVVRDMACITRR
jgi:hypothetical protein